MTTRSTRTVRSTRGVATSTASNRSTRARSTRKPQQAPPVRPNGRTMIRGRQREWYRLNRPLQIAVTCLIVLCAVILAFGLLYDKRKPSIMVRPDPVSTIQKTKDTIHHVEIEASSK